MCLGCYKDLAWWAEKRVAELEKELAVEKMKIPGKEMCSMIAAILGTAGVAHGSDEAVKDFFRWLVEYPPQKEVLIQSPVWYTLYRTAEEIAREEADRETNKEEPE